MAESKTVIIEVDKILRRTDRAILIRDMLGTETWIPLSVIVHMDDDIDDLEDSDSGVIEIEVQKWFADREALS